MFMRENNEPVNNTCPVCGCVVSCRCYLNRDYNRMSESVRKNKRWSYNDDGRTVQGAL